MIYLFLEHAEELSIISLRKKNVQGRGRKLPQPNTPDSSAEHNQTHGMTHERQIILGLPPTHEMVNDQPPEHGVTRLG